MALSINCEEKTKPVLQKSSYVPPLFSIDASLAMTDRHMVLVVAATELLLAAFADKYYCCQSPCDASLRGVRCKHPPSVAPLLLRALGPGPGCSAAVFPCGGCAASTAMCGYAPFKIVSSEKQRSHFSTSDLPSILNGHVSRHFH